MIQLAKNLYLLFGAASTGVLIAGSKALLVDCCDSVTPRRLGELGIAEVEMILLTQHRRPNSAGAHPFAVTGASIVAPQGERSLLEEPMAYWADGKNRWHVYHCQPGPLAPVAPLPVSRGVAEGDVIEWRGYRIAVLDTPGATDGSVSYLIEINGRRICFCGDTMYGPGQVLDLYSLQKGQAGRWDYHGYLGNAGKLAMSLRKIAEAQPDMLVPSHGEPMNDPCCAIGLTLASLEEVRRNFAAISSLNHYFPAMLDDLKDDPKRMKRAQTLAPPPFVRRVAFTSFALVSDNGAALLVDCGRDEVIEALHNWIAEGKIKSVDACWVTHYHDDHVDSLGRLGELLGCQVMTDQHVAEVLAAGERFFLPCQSPNRCPSPIATTDGQCWRWNEFTLTAYHFPGQSYYHAGLLVEGHGHRVFFAGDSGSPTGIDDHCPANRNFLGADMGFRRCIDIWRQTRPDYILNQHQDEAFRFTDEQLDYMEQTLIERKRLWAQVLPWEDPNFGNDEGWARTYPYEQSVRPGQSFSIDVQLTNHAASGATAEVQPVLPAGWRWSPGGGDLDAPGARIEIPPGTQGSTSAYCERPDGAAHTTLHAPPDAAAGLYVIPFRITWNGRHLGQYRVALVNVS